MKDNTETKPVLDIELILVENDKFLYTQQTMNVLTTLLMLCKNYTLLNVSLGTLLQEGR